VCDVEIATSRVPSSGRFHGRSFSVGARPPPQS
jgi:hypothetical protein